MSTNEKKDLENKKTIVGYSFAEKHFVVYVWKINEITTFINSARSSPENLIRMNSAKFSANAAVRDLWDLQLDISSDDKSSQNKSWLSLYLMSNNGDRKIRTEYSFFVLNRTLEKKSIRFEVYADSLKEHLFTYTFEKSNGFGYEHFLKIDDLLEKKDEYLKNDTLTIGVDLVVYDEYKTINNSVDPLDYSIQKMANDFEKLFLTKKKCDVIIKVRDQEFSAHKIILSARSCVFEAMFEHNMKENLENEVTIPDIDPEMFKKVLEYIYTDRVNNIKNFAEELLEISDQYQIEGLKELCEHSLSINLPVKDVMKILILADRQNAKRLMEFVITYVAKNLYIFKKSEDFKALEEDHPSLFYAVLKKKYITENDHY